MTQTQGHCDAKFVEVQRLFQEFLESGKELGASIAVNINERNVVDLWGGFADTNRTRPWTKDTIVNVFSTTKTVTSLALLMLVDRGLLDLNAKVAKYWPEFAENGKQDIEVRHFLTHSSGVPAWEMPITLEDVYNVDQVRSLFLSISYIDKCLWSRALPRSSPELCLSSTIPETSMKPHTDMMNSPLPD